MRKLSLIKIQVSKMPMYDWGDGPPEISIGCSRTTTGGLRYSVRLSDNVIVRYHWYHVSPWHHMSSSLCRLFVRSRHPLGWSFGSCWMPNWRVLRCPLWSFCTTDGVSAKFCRFSTSKVIKSMLTNWLQQTQTAYLCELNLQYHGLRKQAALRERLSEALASLRESPESQRCFQRLFDASLFVWPVQPSPGDFTSIAVAACACCFLMSPWESPRKFQHRLKWSFWRRDDLGLLLRNGFEKRLSNWRCGRSFSICNYFESVHFAL